MEPATRLDLAMVNANEREYVTRDYTRASQVLAAIGLRILQQEGNDEPDAGLRSGVDRRSD